MNPRRTRWLATLTVTVTAAALALMSPAATPTSAATLLARATKTPTTPPVLDSGWVYYFGLDNGTRKIYRSSPDGSTQGEVPGAPGEYGLGPTVGMPSDLRHDGSRWYLAATADNLDVVFPGLAGASLGTGGIALEIDVIREGATAGTRLTNLRDACIALVEGEASATMPQWARSAAGARDAAVTWVGTQWADQDSNPADCEAFVGAGIFRADLVYDSSGAITGIGTPTLALPLGVRSDLMPDLYDYWWSPNAASVAYTRRPGSSGGVLMVAAAGSPVSSHTQLAAGTYYHVAWSPDQDATAVGLQTTIAFTGWSPATKKTGGVWGIQPNGSGLTLLASAKVGTTYNVHYTPMWSPAGSHLAYVEAVSSPFPGYRQVRRMAKDGSGNVVLVAPGPEYSSVLYGLKWADVD